ncbi:lipase 3-like [Armigeres subalbatus]|uniref:lipase 3-like n=1 Tax=Armigeres subalbatus TaxID=124917 RepID=UPI002ED1AABD
MTNTCYTNVECVKSTTLNPSIRQWLILCDSSIRCLQLLGWTVELCHATRRTPLKIITLRNRRHHQRVAIRTYIRLEICSPCAMEVILQLVLIVIPTFIRAEAIDVTAGERNGTIVTSRKSSNNGSSMGIKNFGLTNGRQRFASYERDLVIDAIEAAEYPAEIHVVTTKDGYILKLHRIPDPAFEEDLDSSNDTLGSVSSNILDNGGGCRGVVLLMHGIFSTAADFVVTGPESGLAFVLADAGFDVWMGNARGTRFSRKSLHHTPKDAAFWDFSWHEIGVGDLPAMIDYILRQTNQRQLFYVGHNQGVTALLALLSEKPKYNRKISIATGMAPVAYLGNGNNEIVKNLAMFNDQLWMTLSSLKIFELTPTENALQFVGNIICSGNAPTRTVCNDLLVEMFGYSSEQARLLLPGLLDNALSGISTKQLVHYGQLIQTRKFQQFDYKNFLTNMKRYKQAKPTEYDLSKVTVPFILYSGSKEFFTSLTDFQRLVKNLPTVQSQSELPGWGHLDFIYNAQVYLKVYSKIIEAMHSSTSKDGANGQ